MKSLLSGSRADGCQRCVVLTSSCCRAQVKLAVQLEREMEGAVLPPVDAPRCVTQPHMHLAQHVGGCGV